MRRRRSDWTPIHNKPQAFSLETMALAVEEKGLGDSICGRPCLSHCRPWQMAI